jgi:hypothetical protein
MRQRNGRKNRAGCGNDGAVETMENQTTVFHRSHRSLEIRRTAPDSHIPTASTTGLFFSSRTRKPSRSSGALRARNPSSQLNNPANGEISPFRIILGLEYAGKPAETAATPARRRRRREGSAKIFNRNSFNCYR